jgi:hypothetical protein
MGGGPDSVAFDGALHRIYCAGKTGRLTVVQRDNPNAYRGLDEIHTHYGAHTSRAGSCVAQSFRGLRKPFCEPQDQCLLSDCGE